MAIRHRLRIIILNIKQDYVLGQDTFQGNGAPIHTASIGASCDELAWAYKI